MTAVDKIKQSVNTAPIGAVLGAIGGYFLAKLVGYDKSLPVISFVVVGMITGSTIGLTFKK